MTSQIFQLIASFIIGILSGVVSSILVTHIYRCKDKKIEVSRYLYELSEFVTKTKYFGIVESVPISDHHISYICSVFEKYSIPRRYVWIKLSNKELTVTTDIHNLITKIQIDAIQCQMMIGWIARDNYPVDGKHKLQSKIDDLKLEIVLNSSNLQLQHINLTALLKKYIQ